MTESTAEIPSPAEMTPRANTTDPVDDPDFKTVGVTTVADPTMTCRDVNVFYGDKQAIFNVSIDVGKNEVLAMIGPSGCGKSTLLRCLNRMNDTIDICRVDGEIQLEGENIYGQNMDVVLLRARVGMVFQKPNPFPKSVYDNVAYGVNLHGLADNKDQLDSIVEESLKRAEYMTGVREIEQQIEKIESLGLPEDPGIEAPDGPGTSHQEHLRLLMDMLVLAFKTDSTRISSFILEHEGSNRSFADIGVSDGHHNLSHHKGKKENLDKIAKIDRFYMEQFAYFMEQMNATEDVDGNSLLHNSMILYGSCIADGNRHNNDNIPVVLAGHGGGVFHPGRHVDFGEDVPLSNLYVRMLNEFGVGQGSFGDSNGVLQKI